MIYVFFFKLNIYLFQNVPMKTNVWQLSSAPHSVWSICKIRTYLSTCITMFGIRQICTSKTSRDMRSFGFLQWQMLNIRVCSPNIETFMKFKNIGKILIILPGWFVVICIARSLKILLGDNKYFLKCIYACMFLNII